MKIQGIYAITNCQTGDTYIGSSVDAFRRWTDYKRELRANIHKNILLQTAWNKWGADEFRFQIIEKVEMRCDLICREQHHLDLLRPAYNEVLAAVRSPYRTWRSDDADKERFWSKVEKTANDCWIWRGTLFQQGYGCFKIDGKMYKAHRVAYAYAKGAIDAGLIVCHVCDNPQCVRPDHLFLGTHKDNALDRDAKGRGYFSRSDVKRAAIPFERHGRHLHPERVRGELNPRARLTEDQIAAIRSRYEKRETSQSKLAAEYGVAQTTISAIIRRKTWRD